MAAARTLRIGTRKSALALVQAELVADALRSLDGVADVELKAFTTSGDRKRDMPDADRDKRDWISDMEEALVASEIDLAVHSGKDVPIDIAEGTKLLPVLSRSAPRDVFVPKLNGSGSGPKFSELRAGARIGTASLRRKAQLLHCRRDFEVVEFRGNVPTRLKKLEDDSSLDGIILAQAGIERLWIQDLRYEVLPAASFVPAVNQGILVAQFRGGEDLIRGMVDADVESAWAAERSFIAGVGADCRSSVGVLGVVGGQELHLEAQVLAPDGSECVSGRRIGSPGDAAALGRELAEELLEQGADGLLKGTC